MQFSRYLKIWPYYEEPGYSLLYSTKRASAVLLADEEIEALKQGRGIGEEAEALAELGMLVTDPQTETTEAFAMLDAINEMNPTLSVSVILGMECNFSCTYCYEGTQKGKEAMTDQTAAQLVEFLKKRFRKGKERLTLDFYGGEPLLYRNRIKQLAASLKPFIEDMGAEFNFTLVTNGSLLTAKTVRELVPYGLTAAKITLDGPPANHNRFRPFRNGAASFDCIVKNISECWNLVRIGLGGNFTRENYHVFSQLLDQLGQSGLTGEKLAQVKFSPVMQVNDQFAGSECLGGCESINEPWLVDATLALQSEILRKGYKSSKVSPSTCMVDLDDAFTIHCDGVIYKCAAFIGHDRFKVGDLTNGIGDYRESHNLDSWKKHSECKDCEYLPLCFGGCRYYKFQRDGHLNGVDCQRPYWDATLETYVKRSLQKVHD